MYQLVHSNRDSTRQALMIPMMILHLTNGATYICTQIEANKWAENTWLSKTIVRAEYL